MTDHSLLMRAAAEHDIHHVPLRQAVDFIEAHMKPDEAAEAISLLHAAISPAHAARRHREALDPPVAQDAPAEVVEEPVAEALAEEDRPGHAAAAEPVADEPPPAETPAKGRTPRKPPAKRGAKKTTRR